MLKKMEKWIGLGYFMMVLLASAPQGFCSEQVDITSYYPSPFGIYTEIWADEVTVGSAYQNLGALQDGHLNVSNALYVHPVNPGFPLPAVPISLVTPMFTPSQVITLFANGYAAVTDIYMNDVSKWASLKMKKVVAGNTAVMVLPPSTSTYHVLVFATYFSNGDIGGSFYLWGFLVDTYGSVSGCDQSMFQYGGSGWPPGTYTWSLSAGAQQAFAWVAFEE